MRKLVDKILLKNKTYEEKLKSLNGRLPKNELDRRIFFQETDRQIIECTLLHDVHELVRR